MAEADQKGISPDTTSYARQIPQDESVSTAIVEAVAAASGRSVVRGGSGEDALDPLYETLDPDALDALFATDDRAGTVESLTFEYCGFRVTVTGARRLTVTEC